MLPRQPALIIVPNLPVPLDRRLWLERQALRDSAESSDVATIARTHPVTLEPNQLDRATAARRRQLTIAISRGPSPLEVLWHKRRGKHAGPVGSVTASRLPTTYRLRAGLPRMPVGWVTAYLREVMVRDGSEVIAITVYNASSCLPVSVGKPISACVKRDKGGLGQAAARRGPITKAIILVCRHRPANLPFTEDCGKRLLEVGARTIIDRILTRWKLILGNATNTEPK